MKRTQFILRVTTVTLTRAERLAMDAPTPAQIERAQLRERLMAEIKGGR